MVVILIKIGQRTKNYSDSAMATQKLLDLRCPITKTTLKRPARGLYCKHAEAVSLDHLASVMEKAVGIAWECAICNKPNYKLEIDKRFEKIVEDSRKRSFKPTHCVFTRQGISRFVKPGGHLLNHTDLEQIASDNESDEEPADESDSQTDDANEPSQQPTTIRRSRAAPLHREITTRNSNHRPEQQKNVKRNPPRRKKSESGGEEEIDPSENSDDDGEDEASATNSEQESQSKPESSESQRQQLNSTRNRRIQRLNPNQDDIRKTLRRRPSPPKIELPKGRGGYWHHKKRIEEANARKAELVE